MGMIKKKKIDMIPSSFTSTVETFRSEDEDDYEYEIWLEVLRVFSKYRLPESFILTFFTREVSNVTLSLVKEVTRSPDAKTCNIW